MYSLERFSKPNSCYPFFFFLPFTSFLIGLVSYCSEHSVVQLWYEQPIIGERLRLFYYSLIMSPAKAITVCFDGITLLAPTLRAAWPGAASRSRAASACHGLASVRLRSE